MLSTNLEKVMAYICSKYPYEDELADARLTKMVFLTDWFHSVLTGTQITDIKWLFNHYGPYVTDVLNTAKTSNAFQLKEKQTYYGSNKTVINYIGNESIELDNVTKKIIDRIIEKTKSMYFNDFIQYVYSTYPVKSNDKYAILDLPKIAESYRNSRAEKNPL